MPTMPEYISTDQFLKITWEDYKSPTTSEFLPNINPFKIFINHYDEILDNDRFCLNKLKKSIKALYNSGILHANNDSLISENLNLLGQTLKEDLRSDQKLSNEINGAFIKFSIFTKELSTLMKSLMVNINEVLVTPLDNLLKDNLFRTKVDLRKQFEKSSKEFEIKIQKLTKEKKQAAKEVGMIKTALTGAEIAEDTEKERRLFQLHMCEYLIRGNEICTKKNVELLQNLLNYYQIQMTYFQNGIQMLSRYKSFMDDIVMSVTKLKLRQDLEKEGLFELRDQLKQFMSSYREQPFQNMGYSLRQDKGIKLYGIERSGYLLKKSGGKMRKVWQKRFCKVEEGLFHISHSDSSREPLKLNLLTCQVKVVMEDPTMKCFDLISSSENRTLRFQGDDMQDAEAWMSVLNNAKESILMKAFSQTSCSSNRGLYNDGMKDLSLKIIADIKRLPGNEVCCDCNMPDPEWLSVNLGVLLCLECCGVHRDMGVHISRIQSTIIDEISTSRLLVATSVSNKILNEIFEATLQPSDKPLPKSSMSERKLFIRNKYEQHAYVISTCFNVDDKLNDAKSAVKSRDISALLQVFAEGINFMSPLPDMPKAENSLLYAILNEDKSSLHITDFIIQNSRNQDLGYRNLDGNTALHLCAILNKTESAKLLLKALPDLISYTNNQGLTPMQIAANSQNDIILELMKQAIAGKFELFENIDIDWDISQMDFHDMSDDDLEFTPVRRHPIKHKMRPGSLVIFNEKQNDVLTCDRSLTADNLQITNALNMKTNDHLAHSKNLPPNSLNKLFKKKGPPPPPPVFQNTKVDSELNDWENDNASKTAEKFSTFKPRGSSYTPSLPQSFSNKISNLNSNENEINNINLNLIEDVNNENNLSNFDLDKLKSHVVGRLCTTLFDCDADHPDEISFKSGEVIRIIDVEEEGWWLGYIETEQSRKGLFPSTFVIIE